LFGDEGAHGTIEDPDGEGKVKVKKGRQEGWGVARLEEGLIFAMVLGCSVMVFLW